MKLSKNEIGVLHYLLDCEATYGQTKGSTGLSMNVGLRMVQKGLLKRGEYRGRVRTFILTLAGREALAGSE